MPFCAVAQTGLFVRHISMTPQGTASQPFPEPEENSASTQTQDHSAQDYLSTLLDTLADKIASRRESLDSTLERIAIAAQSFTGASGAAIALRQDGDVVCRARSGDSAPPLGTQLDANSGISGECLRTGQPILVEDTEADPRVDAEVCRSLDLRSIALVAISRDGIPDGVLEVFSTQPEAFDANHVTALQQLARLVLRATAPAAAPVSSPEPQAAIPAPAEQAAPVTRPPLAASPSPAASSAPVQKPASRPVIPPLPVEKVLAPVAPAVLQKPAAPAKAATAPAAPLAETRPATAPVPAKAASPPHDLPAPEFKAAQMQSSEGALLATLKAAWLRPLPLGVLLILVVLGVVYYLFYRG